MATITLSLPEEHKAWLQKEAERLDRTKGWVMRDLIKRAMEAAQKAKAAIR